MVNNFRKLSNASLSIAMAIISFILAVVFFVIGLKYEGNVVAGFVLLTLGLISFGVSSIFSFIKCRQFGNENMKKTQPPKNIENPEKFKQLNNLSSIFMIVFVVLLVVGLIVMLA